MKVAVILLCFVAVAYCSYSESEYHSNDYSSHRSDRVTSGYANSYTYNVGSYKHGSYKRTCSPYRDYNKGVCKNTAYGSGYAKSICRSVTCDFSAKKGLNKCNKEVYLYKPYYCPGKECAYKTAKYCQKTYGGYSSHRPGYGSSSHGQGYGNTGYNSRPQQTCQCQTIWCLKKVWAVVRNYSPKHDVYDKEEIRIKYPCRCACRQKY